MRDTARDVALMLAGVFFGVVVNTATWTTWTRIHLFLGIVLTSLVFVPHLRRVFGNREARSIVRGWRLQGERIRKWIIDEPDAKTGAEQDAQRDRWYQMYRGTGATFGWEQMAAANLGEINTATRRRFENAEPNPMSYPFTWKGRRLSPSKGAVIGRLSAKIDCLKEVEKEL
jgi:hypothetical protein